MVVLVVTTACAVSIFAYFFVAGAPPQGALTAIIGAALAGSAATAVLAFGFAIGIGNGLRRPLPDFAEGRFVDVRREPEQERAYQTLIDNEKMARAIIEEALDAFVQTDGNCVVLNWSPHAEALMGWTREEAVGRSVEKLLFPEPLWVGHRQWVDAFLSQAVGEAAGGRYETPLLRKDGSEFFAEVSLTALRRNDGFIINAFVRDITEKRAAQEQLFQAQKMESVGQLTGGIAHDFNNMLTVITGTIEILADGVKHDPALASIAKMINDAADRASQLTANLLAFARKQPLRPQETDVNALIEEAVKLLGPTLGRQIEIQTVLSDEAWPALVDRGQLTSAMVNLAINARDAMPGGGTLLFKTGNFTRHADDAEVGDLGAGDYVTIEVIDSGAGIPPAIRDRIFEPFFSTKQFGTGTGLGLSMVFGFAKQSGGAVVVDGEEGKGACFRIYLPKADAEPSDMLAARDALANDDVLRGGTETILCVEDDDVVRAHVTGRLQSLGYAVLTASNASEAIDMVDAGAAFDLLFTDIVMPGAMNGRQLAQKVAGLRRPLRVLYTSGNTFGAFADLRPAEGVLLLKKPYRKAELARMVRLALDRAIDHMGDPIPLPYSVQDDLERFLKENPPKGS
jgi:PAS domain S-box-containing protein